LLCPKHLRYAGGRWEGIGGGSPDTAVSAITTDGGDGKIGHGECGDRRPPNSVAIRFGSR